MTARHAPAPPRPKLVPKFWQPKLPASTKMTVQVIHWDLLQRFTDGTATETELWDWIETGLTYTHMAQLLVQDGVAVSPEAQAAIAEQLATYDSVVARFKKSGRVGFSPPEYLAARAAVQSMDTIIHLDRHGAGLRAALQSSAQMPAIRKKYA